MLRHSLTVLACAALLAAAVPASAGSLKACPRFSDPKGDSSLTIDQEMPPVPTVPVSALKDPALDITSVVFKPVGKSLTMAITVDKFSERPMYAPGNRYQLNFNVGEDTYNIYYKNSATRAQEGLVFYQSGVRTNDTFSHADVSATYSKNTITLILSSAAVKATFGSKAIGSKITKISAVAYVSYFADNEYFDVATAPPGLSYVVGSACK